MRCSAGDWTNFIRVDDDGNEIIPKIVSSGKEEDPPVSEKASKPTREDLLKMLDGMVESIENLPSHAMSTPINHYDLISVLMLLSSILKSP